MDWLCAGHFPMVPSNDPQQVRASLLRIQGSVPAVLRRRGEEFVTHAEGLTVDELYESLRKNSSPPPYITFLMANQFPVFTTFMKLTLLNHLLLYNFPSRKEHDGKIRFFVPGPK